MRKRNLLSRFALAAIATGSITIAGQLQAGNDFDALLAEVDFGQASEVVEETVTPSASDIVELNAEPIRDPAPATELASTPAAEALTMPQDSAAAATESLPTPPPPAAEPATEPAAEAELPPAEPVPAAAAGVGSAACGECASCNNHCQSGCGHQCGLKGHQFIKDGFCQPYTPPRLPTSTFYQYWRSNACNVNVWDGFKNRCHPHIDLSLHHNKGCGCDNGCDSGCSAGSLDCGPAPAEWSR